VRLKSFDNSTRVKDVEGAPVSLIRNWLGQVDRVLWMNTTGLMEESTATEVLGQLSNMPDDNEVVIIWEPSYRRRGVPVITGYKLDEENKQLIISTCRSA
jgi:hypothetical protein